jgi:hypothetical protein
MSNHERRNSIALDDALNYCRLLDTRAERPVLFKLCGAIRTLDLALAVHEGSPIPVSLSTEAWSRVRDSLYDVLISSFAGTFELYDTAGNLVPPAGEWPSQGRIEFFPDTISRRNDSYTARIERLSPSITTALRWSFAEGRTQILPGDFDKEEQPELDETPEDARDLLERLYSLCEEQAHEGKKKAHRKWWQLYWEANSCPNKRQKHELQKQMVALEGIWGKPVAD